MATHSSILARRIPWTEEPDGLQSVGSQRAGLSGHKENPYRQCLGQGLSKHRALLSPKVIICLG